MDTVGLDGDAMRGTDGVDTATMRGTDGANTTTPPTVGAISDGVWDEARAGHVGAGTYGLNTGDAAMRGTDGVDTATMRGTNGAATPAQVNAEVLDVMNVDTFVEPGQLSPPATDSIFAKINFLYKSWRNLKNGDGTTTQLFADDGVTVDQKQTTSSAGGIVTKAEWVTGP